MTELEVQFYKDKIGLKNSGGQFGSRHNVTDKRVVIAASGFFLNEGHWCVLID